MAGITWVEILICIMIVGVLAALALPAVTCGPVNGQQTQTLSNMKQLHLATLQMALDGVSMTNTNLGWPGDTGGTFSNWTAQLVPAYLSTNDLCKLLSAPGKIVPAGVTPTMAQSAVLVYTVREDSTNSAVFLTSANFTNTPNGGILNPDARPYGKKVFVVFRKGGDGAILPPKQVGQTNIIGSFVPLCR